MKAVHWCMAVVLIVFSASGMAQDDANQPWEEYGKLIDGRKSVATLGPTLFGDQVSLVNGALSFSQTDVSLPGNNALPVALTRTFTVSNRKGTNNDAPLADWDLDLPRISGVFAGAWPDHRCSASSVGEARPPTITQGLATYTPEDYWQGISASMPGGGEMLLADSTTLQPSAGGPYYWLTKDLTYFSCLPSIQNGSGEGFRAITSDGIKYTFDWLAHFSEPRLKDDKIANNFLWRSRYVLYVTRVEDRFGNWVRYNYAPVSFGVQLASITASDGRQLVLTYNAQGHVASVSNGSQVWTYEYNYPSPLTGTLTRVTLPDQSQWLVDFAAFSRAVINNGRGVPSEPTRNCWDPGDVISPGYTGTVTHPSGAVGTFAVAPTRHGRSNVPMVCVNYDELGNVGDDYAYYPQVYDALSLTQKTITGPGLTEAIWTYSYTSDYSFAAGTGPVCTSGDCGAPVCLNDSCAGTAVTTVTGPGEWTRYTHGNSYRYNEGLLLKIERGSGPTAILNTETKVYELAQSGQPYPTPIGSSIQPRNDSFGAQSLLPQRSNVIAQDGVTFTWQVDTCGTTLCFDALARPTRVSKSSSLGYSRSEATVYADILGLWVLGNVASVADLGTGKKLSETTYDGKGMPISRKAFGLLRQTLTYNLDGTVATAGDGNGHITTVSGWMRGIPQSIRFADNSTRSAVVDGLGQITSTTDELGTTTSYTYDAMGRLASLSLPGWTPTGFSFVPVASTEFGLPAGHWRLTETTGSYRKTTYFDARFRPVLTREEDTGNASTQRTTRRAFDHENRETYVSYPAAGDPGLGAGTSSSYDALGRVTSTSQNSELGTLTTTTAYLSGFQTRTTNPRGQATTVSYQVYDQPDTSAPVSILGPDGVSTTIARDGFGMPLSVTRSGTYNGLPVSATRNYVYDGFERLCKRIEPEAGGTLFQYDGVGNLIGSAEGQSSSLSCDAIPAGARIGRSYDARDRLLSTTYPNAPITLYSYAADGALTTLTQGESVWDYSYNNRRLLTSETLSFGDTYSFNYSYNALGHLASSSTPSGLTIDYAPNALGQPTKAGTFASGATYFPDGSLKQFTYGNGLIHSVTQNARHLPSQVRDASGSTVVHDFSYSYDPNGNVTAITDAIGPQTRSPLLYDARDRLVSATAEGLWGVASYAYDPLDNLRSADQGSRQYRYQYDTNNRLTRLTDPTGTPLPGLDFAYDAQGRQIRKGSQTRSFDGANRITAIGGETYAYDGNGRRIATWAADGRTKVEVYTQNGQLGFAVDSAKGGGSSFVYLAGQRIAEDHWNCGTNTHTVSYYHADALGSPVATTDAARNVLERTYYAPYGEAVNRTVDGPGYTGHVMDAATGLVYAQQRYYDPLVGKFLSIDPVAADPSSGGNFNRYWYANDNPYKFTDPDGRCTGSRITNEDGTCKSSGGFTTQSTSAASSESKDFTQQNIDENIGIPMSGDPNRPFDGPLECGVNAICGEPPPVGPGGLLQALRSLFTRAGARVEGAVIGRVKDLQKLEQGEKSLLSRLPDQGSPQANWRQNSGVLRQEMAKGLPIRDASPGDTAGQFLNAERNLLRDRGWRFDPNTNYWNPPAQ